MSWSIRTSPAVLVPSLARIPRLPWLWRSFYHAATRRDGQTHSVARLTSPARPKPLGKCASRRLHPGWRRIHRCETRAARRIHSRAGSNPARCAEDDVTRGQRMAARETPSMSDGEGQDAVFAFLSDPATHGGGAVKRIDTHAASVFLAGEHAFKVKRAVRFPFLDFSTLAKRKSACEAELRINRSFAPDIYRRVVGVTREADGRLTLDGTGTPVEWVLEMRRFDENATLDRMAQAGKGEPGPARS